MPHTTMFALHFLHEIVGPRMICSHFARFHAYGEVWSPHSRDMIHFGCSIWDMKHGKLYSRKPGSLMELEAG